MSAKRRLVSALLVTITTLLVVLPASAGAVTWFEDNFDGTSIDAAKWNTSIATGTTRWCGNSPNNMLAGSWRDTSTVPGACGGSIAPSPYGSIAVAGGEATFAAGVGRVFPWIWRGVPSRPSPFPPTGAFTMETRMHFVSTGPNGAFLLANENLNTDPTGTNAPGGTGLGVFGINPQGPIFLGTQFTVTAGYHTYRLEFDGINKYTLYLDNVRLAGPTTSTLKVNNFMMGNPLFAYWSEAEWADFTIDYLRVTIPGYPRPKGAGPARIALVPAYEECGTITNPSDRTHGPALAYPSCASPTQTSAFLTIGTTDANGQNAKSIGLTRLIVVPDNTGTPADEADLSIEVSMTDVREQGTLADYTGELEARPTVRFTDQVDGGGPLPATTEDVPFPVSVPCSATVDTTIGSACAITTSANAVLPGSVVGGRRSIWALDKMQVYDGGSDGSAATTADNTLFATQGLFVP
jgi:hypothetical protein